MSNQDQTSFHFHFWKDKIWVGVMLLPLGMLLLILPVFLYLKLDLPSWFRMLVLLVIGFPGYYGFSAILYILMERAFSRVTFGDQEISFCTPWSSIFPFVLITKHIPITSLSEIKFFAPYPAAREYAIQLTYQQGKRKRLLKIPQFKDSRYLHRMKALQDLIEPPAIPAPSSPRSETLGTLTPMEPLVKAKHYPGLRSGFFSKILIDLVVFSLAAAACISGWITLALPVTSKFEAFILGAALCFQFNIIFLVVCGFLPGMGQVVFWFVGHPIIRAVLWLFQMADISWETPPVVNQFLARWNIPPVHSTLVEFLFWAVLVISMELSVGNVMDGLWRRAYKKSSQSQGEEK